MTPHINASKGDYAQAVLLPGDPMRAKWIAETFLEEVRCINTVRGCFGYTGTFGGVPVSVQATGMGQPSAAIYTHELLEHFGVRRLIRIGTCGGLQEYIKLRTIIAAQAASTDSSINRNLVGAFDFAPVADFALLRSAATKAEEAGLPFHVGNTLSSDIFYHPRGLAYYEALRQHGVLAVEMEASAIYTLAARFSAQALAICSVTDCLITGEKLTAAERQSTLVQMTELGLNTAVE